MSESPYPSQNQDKFVVRLPDGMRDRIKAAAEANNRSMNAEIVATLEEKYPGVPPEIAAANQLIEKVFDLMQRIASAESENERTRLLGKHTDLALALGALCEKHPAVRKMLYPEDD